MTSTQPLHHNEHTASAAGRRLVHSCRRGNEGQTSSIEKANSTVQATDKLWNLTKPLNFAIDAHHILRWLSSIPVSLDSHQDKGIITFEQKKPVQPDPSRKSWTFHFQPVLDLPRLSLLSWTSYTPFFTYLSNQKRHQTV